MANLRFNVKVFLDNPGVLPELQARMADLRPAFEAIYRDWVDINEQKFEQSVGHEQGGAQVFEEFWAGLSNPYMEQKHGMGTARVTKKMAKGGEARFNGAFPDWLMVRTGALRQAMTDPEALFHDIEPGQAVFGTPLDPDLADIVRWQAGEKQHHRDVIFLSLPDMNAIRRNIQDYLSMGGDFTEMRADEALSAVHLEQEVNAMDAEFANEVYE